MTSGIDRVTRGTARARLERNIYTALGFAAVALGVLLYPGYGGIQGQHPQLYPAYAVGLAVVAVGLPAMLGIMAWWAPRRTTRAVAGVTTLVFLVGMATFPLGLIGDHLDHDQPPWFQGIHAVHAMTAAIVWQHRAVWLVGIAHGPIIGLVHHVVRPDSTRNAVVDALGSTTFALILMGVAIALIMAADRQDQAASQARALAVQGAAARTREREEARINAMVHDDIMSVLIAASRENPPAGLRDTAREALAAIAELGAPSTPADSYSVDEFVHLLRHHATAIAPDVKIVTTVQDGPALPADVVAAITEAMEEALRNSVRHAHAPGKIVVRHLTVRISEQLVEVRVHDTGRGFDHRLVKDRQLGIRLSIIERMALVEGGHAAVTSLKGTSTTVTLRWERTP